MKFNRSQEFVFYTTLNISFASKTCPSFEELNLKQANSIEMEIENVLKSKVKNNTKNIRKNLGLTTKVQILKMTVQESIF